MATISGHTTRAAGTILTATIYNSDHVNHVTNAQNLNADKIESNSVSSVDGHVAVFDGVGGDIIRTAGFPPADDGAVLKIANNLSDLGNASTARDNIGLGPGNSPQFTDLTLTGNLDLSGYMDLAELGSNPSNPSANVFRFFVRDDGSGNTEAVLLDSGGSELIVLDAATVAEMQAATSSKVAATPDNLINHPAVPKAWGVVASDGSLAKSYNVASLGPSGSSQDVNLDVEMADTDYAIIIGPSGSDGDEGNDAVCVQRGTKTTTGFTLHATNVDDNPNETSVPGDTSFAVFGDLA